MICLFPSDPRRATMARVIASFVAESKKVTFDVKYSGLRPQNPADELCDGRTASSVIAALAKAARVSNEAAIVLEKSVLHRCRSLPPGFGQRPRRDRFAGRTPQGGRWLRN